jgi:uncharacterized membrane protein YfcA
MLFVVSGFMTGILGGLFGVGGGEIFIPLLIYLFGFSQHKAQGTSLAVLLPPIGLLALGFFFGASIGALIATRIHKDILRRIFSIFLLIYCFAYGLRTPRKIKTSQKSSSVSCQVYPFFTDVSYCRHASVILVCPTRHSRAYKEL